MPIPESPKYKRSSPTFEAYRITAENIEALADKFMGAIDTSTEYGDSRNKNTTMHFKTSGLIVDYLVPRREAYIGDWLVVQIGTNTPQIYSDGSFFAEFEEMTDGSS